MLFWQETSVSKKFPTLASPRLYLVIFFQIYGCDLTHFTCYISGLLMGCVFILKILKKHQLTALLAWKGWGLSAVSFFSCVVSSFLIMVRPTEQVPIQLPRKKSLSVLATVLMQYDNNILLIVSNPQGILDQQLRPHPIHHLLKITIIILFII